MDVLTSMWRNLTNQRRESIALSVVLAGSGVILIAVGELAEWGWTRLAGALAISIGASIVGLLLGWVEPGWALMRSSLKRFAPYIAILLAAIILVPAAIALVSLLIGVLTGASYASGWLMLIGTVMTLSMLFITAMVAGEAIRCLYRAAGDEPGQSTLQSNGKNSE